MTAPTSKLDTIRKLLAKAERAATEAEAESYTAKAAQLMARHGIDEALLAAAGEKTDNMESREVAIENPYSMEKSKLIGWIAAALGCRWSFSYYKGTRTVTKVNLFGFASDLERAEMIYTSLLVQATGQLVRQYPSGWGESVAAYRRSWLAGYADMVSNRIRWAEEAAKEQAVAAEAATPREGVSTEMVFVDRKAKIDRFYEESTSNLVERKASRYTGSGFDDGMSAGRKADLGTDKRVSNGTRRAIG